MIDLEFIAGESYKDVVELLLPGLQRRGVVLEPMSRF
jgi:hypothetical protein